MAENTACALARARGALASPLAAERPEQPVPNS
jgi:hypothetical protein